MAGQARAAAAPVAFREELSRAPFRFDFFRALRLLECAHPDKPRLGQAARPADEPVRLGQDPSLAFAPSTLASFRPEDDGGPAHLAVFFLGLFGPNGPLPLHLTEYARDRVRNQGDPTFARFADLFHHRILSLFYRAWADAQPSVSFDRPETDRFSTYVGAFFGLGPGSLRDRDAWPDLAKLHYAGRLSCGSRNAEGLADVIEGFFGVPTRIEQFVGHWLDLPPESQCRLGASPESGTLGVTAVSGSRVWICQDKFRIVLGPLALSEYRRLLSGTEGLARLAALVRNYVGDEFDWDVNLILRRDEVPPLVLGGEAQLGLTAWLRAGSQDRDPSDLFLTPTVQ